MLKKQRGDNITEYAPILEARLTMDESTEVTLKRKFDIACFIACFIVYFIAKEKLAFTKMKPLCDLQECHRVDLGARYKNDVACSTVVSYIAAEERHKLLETLSKVKFFSVQADEVQMQGMLKMSSTQCSTLNPKQMMVRFMYTTSFSL